MNQVLRTRQSILTSAATVLATNPGASTSDIANAAGVGRATLHRHYRHRDALIEALQAEAFRETNDAVKRGVDPDLGAREQLLQLFEVLVPLGNRFAFLARTTLASQTLATEYQAQLEWLGELVRKLRDEDAIASDVTDVWVVSQIDQLIWSSWQAVASGHLAARAAPGLCTRTLLKGVSP